MTIPHKVQLMVGVFVVLLLFVFLLINRQTAEVDFIFGTFVVSRAILVLSFFSAGMLVGWVAHSIVGKKKRRQKSRSNQ